MKKQILVVEDEEIIAMDLCESLERMGYGIVDSVSAGEDALNVLKKHQPDLIFMDIYLAGELSGIQTAKIINEKHDIPIVYLTSYSNKSVLDEALESGPSGYILKPFNKDKIRTTIEVVFRNHENYQVQKREKMLLVENIHELEARKKKLEKESLLISMQIQDLNETTKHLAAAAFREREEKKKISEEKENLIKEKELIKMQIDDLAQTNKLLAEATFRERKQKEEYFIELQEKNKKITDSINYAKRIQNSIVPGDEYMRGSLGEYFSLYIPKDIVCGDFPWIFNKDEHVYFAAVDCTGHGVPGAMMSIIGYLLLNDIVNNSGELLPSQILFHLDKAVADTLKQNKGGSEARDGMDIALCRLNKKTLVLDYAGAHRPLYYYSKDDLHQIKGDRKAIGGVNNRKKEIPFTNTTVELSKGDAIYIFSDGFPDQFGGPENFKYGPKRIRRTIKQFANLQMEEQGRIFEEEFYKWKGNEKQMDDVLIMGIKI